MDPQSTQPQAPVNPLLAHLNDTDEAHASTRVDFAHPGTIVHPQGSPQAAALEGEASADPALAATKTPKVPTPPPATPPPPPPVAPAAPKSPRNARPIIIAVIVILILAAAGGGAYWWFKIRKPATSTNAPASQTVTLTAVAPTALAQTNSSGQAVVAGGALRNPLELDFSLTTDANSGSATPQVEVQPLGTAFTGQSNYSGSAVTATGNAVTAKVPVADLKDGSYHWQARFSVGDKNSDWVAFAAAGTTSADFIIDSTAPAAAVVTTVGSQAVKAGATAVTTTSNPSTLAGTAEVSDKISITIQPDNQTATATADSSGHWTATLPSALTNGSHTIAITATDAAGNTTSSSFTVNSNTAVATPATPSAPAATKQLAATGTGTETATLIGLILIVISGGGLIVAARHGHRQV